MGGKKGKNQTKANQKGKKDWVCICPVCKRKVTSTSFTCTHCKPSPQWVHNGCGGYKYADVRKAEPGSLRCNNCKESTASTVSECAQSPEFLPQQYPSKIPAKPVETVNEVIMFSDTEEVPNSPSEVAVPLFQQVLPTSMVDELEAEMATSDASPKERTLPVSDEPEAEMVTPDASPKERTLTTSMADEPDVDFAPQDTEGNDFVNMELEASTAEYDDSEAEVETEDEAEAIPYELISKKGNKLGTVKIVKTDVNELVHGQKLRKGERKVLVTEVYEDHLKEAEEEEFVKGAFLRVEAIMLKQIAYKKKASRRKGRGQKIGLSPKKWSRSKKKAMRNSGKSYVTASGKLVPDKKFTFLDCACKHKNCKDLSEEARKSAHTAFWAMGNYDDQNAYILTLISSQEKKVAKLRKEGVTSKPKSKSRYYRINDIDVCKEVFKSTFSISNGRLGRLLPRYDKNPNELPKDKRGPKENQGVDEKIIEKMIEIIQKLPKYTSHYCREKENDNTVFLEPDCQWDTVYGILEEEVPLNTKLPSKTWFYKRVKTLFPHVKTHTPSTDKCNTCTLLKLQGKEKDLEEHQERAERFREQMAKDLKKKYCITFDLQQVQALP